MAEFGGKLYDSPLLSLTLISDSGFCSTLSLLVVGDLVSVVFEFFDFFYVFISEFLCFFVMFLFGVFMFLG
jgi:hypothetical protein